MSENIAPDTLQKVIAGTAPLNLFLGFNRQTLDAMAAFGFNLYEQGKSREAEKIFRGLIAIDSTLYYGYAGLGALALSDERADEAIPFLVKAVELNPNDASVHANLGEALLRQAKFDDAARHFGRALDLDPDEKDPGANRARAILEGMEILIKEFQRMDTAPNA
jgi:tetratricopeptide (TPR) repeat protein